jgi:hypothetical protein
MTDFNDTNHPHNPQTWHGTAAVAVFLKKGNRLGVVGDWVTEGYGIDAKLWSSTAALASSSPPLEDRTVNPGEPLFADFVYKNRASNKNSGDLTTEARL